MPIEFRAPQPFAPAASADAAAANVALQAAPTIADLYARAGAQRQQAAIAEANRFAQNAQVGAQLGQRAQESADELQLRRDALIASRGPSARDVFNAQVADSQAVQHARLQAWVHAQDFTFQDNQRLANQQAALAEVQRAYDQKEITQDEWKDMVLELKSGIDPAKQRQQRALAQQEEARAKAFEEQATRQTAVNLKNAALDAMTIQQRIRTVAHPEVVAQVLAENPGMSEQQAEAEAIKRGGATQWIIAGYDQYGHAQWKQVDHPTRGKAGTGDTGVGGLNSEQYLKHYDRALEQVDKLIERNEELRTKTDAQGKSLGLGDPNITWANRTQLLAERLRGMGLAPTLQEHLSRGQQGGAPGKPAAQAARPFDWNERQTQTPAQANLVRDWGIDRRKIEQDEDLDPFRKQQVLSAMETVKDIVQQSGGLPPAGTPQRQQLDFLSQFIEANKPRKRAPAPPGPTRPGFFSRAMNNVGAPPVSGGGGY